MVSDDYRKERMKDIAVWFTVMAIVFILAISSLIWLCDRNNTVHGHYEGYVESVVIDDGVMTVILNNTTSVSMRVYTAYQAEIVIELGEYYSFDTNWKGSLLNYEKLEVYE